jgi:hypothetical protein
MNLKGRTTESENRQEISDQNLEIFHAGVEKSQAPYTNFDPSKFTFYPKTI